MPHQTNRIMKNQLIKLGAEVQQSDVLWTNSKECSELAKSFGLQVNELDGVKGYSAYIFLS